MPLLGTAHWWVLFPFLLATVALIWMFIIRNYRDAELLEELRLWPDRAELTRQDRTGSLQRWHANLYWVEITLYPAGGPAPNYLTLKGKMREVEIGSFLSEEERLVLHEELVQYFNALGRK